MRARRSTVSAERRRPGRRTPARPLAGLALVTALAAAGCGGADDTRGEDAPTTTTAKAAVARPALCSPLRASIRGRVRAATATELSGLVLSRSQRGVLWTHNDSGDSPRVLAVGLDGRLLADVAVAGAEAFDWEDIAAGPAQLYIGDIGDNVPQRDSIVVYRIDEPRVRGGAPPTSALATRFELRYPDGRHNAEALLRDPSSGALVIVTKSAVRRAGIYVATHPAPGATATMRRRGKLRVGPAEVTAGDVSADGRTIVLRTYSDAFVWRRRPGESVATALTRRPCQAGAALLREGQGEALALAADGRAFYTVPEGTSPAIRRYAPG